MGNDDKPERESRRSSKIGKNDETERESRRTSGASTTCPFNNDQGRHSYDQTSSEADLNEASHISIPLTPSTTQASPRRGRSGSLFDEVANMGMKQTRRLSLSPTRKSPFITDSEEEFSSNEDENGVGRRRSAPRSGLSTPRSGLLTPNRGFESGRRRRQQRLTDLLLPQTDGETKGSPVGEEELNERGERARNHMASTVQNFKESRLSLDRSTEMSRRSSLNDSRMDTPAAQGPSNGMYTPASQGPSTANSNSSARGHSEARKTNSAQSSPMTPLQKEFQRVLTANPGSINAFVVASYEKNQTEGDNNSRRPSWLTDAVMEAYIRDLEISISPSSPDFLRRPRQPHPAPSRRRQRRPGTRPTDNVVYQKDAKGQLIVDANGKPIVDYLEDKKGTKWDLDGKEQSEEEE